MSAPTSDRARAAQILVSVLREGKTTDQAFGSSPTSLVQELVYGVLRHFYSLNAAVEKHLARALRGKDHDLRMLMLVGAYQLAHTRIPAHAAINETVNACRRLRKPWAVGLLNGVLRSLLADVESGQIERSIELPPWIWTKLRDDLGADAQAVANALLQRAPMSLRVNVVQTTPERYAERLDALELGWQQGPFPENLVLEQPIPRRDLPGHAAGEVSIQDSGALFAAHLLSGDGRVPARVLDACAAPGGKLFHLCERLPGAELVALESSPRRFQYLTAERTRLGHTRVSLLQADATRIDWWDDHLFDAVLLDAPCSGVGTLRRHPDIKHLRSPADLPRYQSLQGALLRNLWRVLAPGGTLLYCTCSLFQEENDNVVFQFLAETDDAVSLPLDAPEGQRTPYGWQLLPGLARTCSPDGFYFARIDKTTASRQAQA